VVFIAIFATLFIGRPLATYLGDQNLQAVFFVSGMLLVGAAILIHAIKTKPGRNEIAILLGVIAVYTMFIFRLGAPERSHLIEYSVLALCIHKALIERAHQGKAVHSPAFLAWVMAFLLGVLDEAIQIYLPNRVFDPLDILFNGLAVTMAIGSSALLNWARKRIKKSAIK
jgi:hypothetical protein